MFHPLLLFLLAPSIFFFLLFLWERKKGAALRQRLLEEEYHRKHAEERFVMLKESTSEKIEHLRQTHKEMAHHFEALSSEALRKNATSFLELATTHLSKWQEGAAGELKLRQQAMHQLVDPLQKALKSVDEKIGDLEKARTTAYASLQEQVRSLIFTQNELRHETTSLSQALRSSSFRGRWGEMQLRRVLELAGMLEHCDFFEQQTIGEEEQSFRPDVIIHLPYERQIVIDAKTPLQSYLEALEAKEEKIQEEKRAEHARHLRRHIGHLASKGYWKQLKESPEFVILFVPGEPFFRTALESDPGLIEYGIERRVILATPLTLMALLLALSQGWKQKKMTENAEEICQLAKTLYDRLQIVLSHFQDVKRGIERTQEAYEKTVRSIETRLRPTVDRFHELGMGKGKQQPEEETMQETAESFEEERGEEDPLLKQRTRSLVDPTIGVDIAR